MGNSSKRVSRASLHVAVHVEPMKVELHEIVEPQQMSCNDSSPLFPFLHEPYRPYLLYHVPIMPLVDIIMAYGMRQQHLITIRDYHKNNDSTRLKASPWSIGWISSQLPCRPNGNIICSITETEDIKRDSAYLVDDTPGYCRIFGTFPPDWQTQNVAIIDTRLYLIGTRSEEPTRCIRSPISCSIDDILASSLSSALPSVNYMENGSCTYTTICILQIV
jgi:hypothetical protein